tara:strand:- start:19202 stop:19504 length:303 start_codon:yes stop_codon:yes gene_type:complete
MNEIEEWFLTEFGHMGFSLTPMMYCPEWFAPFRRVIYENEVISHIKITPEVANDVTGGFVPLPDPVREVKQLITEQLLLFLEEKKDKDFKPIQKLNRFKL